MRCFCLNLLVILVLGAEPAKRPYAIDSQEIERIKETFLANGKTEQDALDYIDRTFRSSDSQPVMRPPETGPKPVANLIPFGEALRQTEDSGSGSLLVWANYRNPTVADQFPLLLQTSIDANTADGTPGVVVWTLSGKRDTWLRTAISAARCTKENIEAAIRENRGRTPAQATPVNDAKPTAQAPTKPKTYEDALRESLARKLPLVVWSGSGL